MGVAAQDMLAVALVGVGVFAFLEWMRRSGR
jgi:hypothetical protein